MDNPNKEFIDALVTSALHSIKTSESRQFEGVLSDTSDYLVRVTGPFSAIDLRNIAAALEVAAQGLGDAVIGIEYRSHQEKMKGLQELVHEVLAKKQLPPVDLHTEINQK